MVIILVLPPLSMAFEWLLKNIIYKCFHITLDKQTVLTVCPLSFLSLWSKWLCKLPVFSFFLTFFCFRLFVCCLFVCFGLLVIYFTHYFGYNSGLSVPFVSSTGKEVSLLGKSLHCTVIPESLVLLLDGVYSPKMKGANQLKFVCHQGKSLVNNFSLCNNWYKSVVLSLIWLHSLVCPTPNKQMSQLVAYSGNICVWVVSCNECGGWQFGRCSASIKTLRLMKCLPAQGLLWHSTLPASHFLPSFYAYTYHSEVVQNRVYKTAKPDLIQVLLLLITFICTILGSWARSFCLHVILHEWIAFYSVFLKIHRSSVLPALAWLVPHETTAISAHFVYTIQPCTMSLHAKPYT